MPIAPVSWGALVLFGLSRRILPRSIRTWSWLDDSSAEPSLFLYAYVACVAVLIPLVLCVNDCYVRMRIFNAVIASVRLFRYNRCDVN